VLPVRGEARGKSRLARLLDRGARMRLNRKLLRHALHTITQWQGTAKRCIVVTACARSGIAARRAGAIWLQEPQPRRGLSRAVAYAVAIAARRGARAMLVLNGDLPLLSPAALQDFVRAADGAAVALAPDRTRTGTNAVLLTSHARFAFAYGPGSLALHLASAQARGWTVAVCERTELAFDLDTPADIAAWRAGGSAKARGSRWYSRPKYAGTDRKIRSTARVAVSRRHSRASGNP
jgi:2-phospho-L-lactate guanylyltransferase